MAHESFESEDVARILNAHFVSIKLDREERPDVDALYMRAVQALTGGGGWPMSVWLTPEGVPFFAGTYFPQKRFLQICQRVHEIWASDRSTLLKDSQQLLGMIRSMADEDSVSETQEWNLSEAEDLLSGYINHFQNVYDERFGGFGRAPKFPQTMNLMLMMRQDHKTGLGQAEAMVTETLHHMLRGGMYDHLMGGFHRYSVDEKWLVPHFEKMLYDQALLSVTLIEAHSLYGGAELARAARETLDYVLREMTSPEGGFYCAQDADSLDPETNHMEEGHFATYLFSELKDALTAEELASLQKVYGVCEEGQFEGRNILHLQSDYDGTAKSDPKLKSALEKLVKIREGRPAPHLDRKVVVSWNAWMIWAFTKAGVHFQEPRYLEAAKRAIHLIREKIWQKGRLSRYWAEGEGRGPAMAEDYSALIHALLEFAQAQPSFDLESWVLDLQKVLDEDFWDQKESGYFTGQGGDSNLPFRTKDDYDGVHPSASAMAAWNLERLYALTGREDFRKRSDQIFKNLFGRLREYPSSLPFLGLALDWRLSGARVAIYQIGGWTNELRKDLASRFVPYLFWVEQKSSWPVTQGKSMDELYLCEAGHCLAPINDKSTALKMIIPAR